MNMNRTNTAGRILVLLLTALLVLSLAACGTKDNDKRRYERKRLRHDRRAEKRRGGGSPCTRS